MTELTPALPLRIDIRRALEGKARPERALLAWLDFDERGNWAACDLAMEKTGAKSFQLLRAYAEAVEWAEEALRFAV